MLENQVYVLYFSYPVQKVYWPRCFRRTDPLLVLHIPVPLQAPHHRGRAHGWLHRLETSVRALSVPLTPVSLNLMLPLLICKSNKYFNFSDWKRNGILFMPWKHRLRNRLANISVRERGTDSWFFWHRSALFIVSELMPPKGSFCIAPGGFKQMAKPLHFYPAHETLAALLWFWSIFPLCLVSGSAGRSLQP